MTIATSRSGPRALCRPVGSRLGLAAIASTALLLAALAGPGTSSAQTSPEQKGSTPATAAGEPSPGVIPLSEGSPAEARRVIRVLRGWRVIAGGFDTQRGIAAAERALGRAEIRPSDDGFGCDVRWPSLGADFFFYDLGGQGDCHPTGASVGSARLTGAVWATWRGIRIGDPEGLVRRRHREAILCDRPFMSGPAGRESSARLRARELRNLRRRCARLSSPRGTNRYWLAPVYSPIGDGGFYPRVSVVAHGGTVTAFDLSIGAGGD